MTKVAMLGLENRRMMYGSLRASIEAGFVRVLLSNSLWKVPRVVDARDFSRTKGTVRVLAVGSWSHVPTGTEVQRWMVRHLDRNAPNGSN